jgi:hypothetical protein
MAENLKMINQIIDDLALGKYDSVNDAVDDLISYGVDPVLALNSVLAMDTIDVVP